MENNSFGMDKEHDNTTAIREQKAQMRAQISSNNSRFKINEEINGLHLILIDMILIDMILIDMILINNKNNLNTNNYDFNL